MRPCLGLALPICAFKHFSKLSILFLTIPVLILGITTFARSETQRTSPLLGCPPTDSLIINSGWNQASSAVWSIGDYDNEWMLVSDPDPATSEPRPANVVDTFGGWATPQSNSQWITCVPYGASDLNGHYIFQYRFCLQSTQGASLFMKLRADDEATIYLNGNYLGSTFQGDGSESFRPSQSPRIFQTSNAAFFLLGQNVITVNVENRAQVAVGYDLVGVVHAFLAPSYHYCCTDSASAILGSVWSDRDADGVMDANEPGLEGWTVQLSNGQSAVSDQTGAYYFVDLVPGSYTVSESPNSGWTQTTQSSYNLTLNLGDVQFNNNFGNKSNIFADNCSIPDTLTLGSDGPFYCFSVVVRDVSNNPVVLAPVQVDLGSCPIIFCLLQPVELTVFPSGIVSVVTNAAGASQFCICAHMTSSCLATVSADGVVLRENVVVEDRGPNLRQRFVKAPRRPRGGDVAQLGAIQFTVTAPEPVAIRIYDVAGRIRKSFDPKQFDAGEHLLNWDGIGEDGKRLAAGIYFADLTYQTSHRREVHRLVLIR